MNRFVPLQEHLLPLRQRCYLAGVLLTGVGLLGLLTNPQHFLRSWLFAWYFWTAISLGCLALQMIYRLTSGRWGFLAHRIHEAGAQVLPLQGLLILPILLGVRSLFPWAEPGAMAASHHLEQKELYLNVPFFMLRQAIYFVIWIGLAWQLRRLSLRLDRDPEPRRIAARLRVTSAIGLILFVLTVSFATLDWLQSLEPEWYSTIYSVIMMMGQGVSAMALAIIVLTLMAGSEPIRGLVNPRVLRDLGNLLLAFILLWTYTSFSQYLIIYSGNLAEEVPWYLHRNRGGWRLLTLLLMLGQFFLPFIVLLQRGIKHRPHLLAMVAAFVIAMRWIDIYWTIMPAFYERLTISWIDPVLLLGLGGLWLGAFFHALSRAPLLATYDPHQLRVGLLREAHDHG